MTMDPCIKGLDRKAQPIQGWPTTFSCCVASDFASNDN